MLTELHTAAQGRYLVATVPIAAGTVFLEEECAMVLSDDVIRAKERCVGCAVRVADGPAVGAPCRGCGGALCSACGSAPHECAVVGDVMQSAPGSTETMLARLLARARSLGLTATDYWRQLVTHEDDIADDDDLADLVFGYTPGVAERALDATRHRTSKEGTQADAAKLFCNAFAACVSPPRGAIGDDVRCAKKRGGLCADVGAAISPNVARLNHACDANAYSRVILASEAGGRARVEVRALADVAVGQELCISYIDVFATGGVAARRDALHKAFFFECNCTFCAADELCQENVEAAAKKRRTRGPDGGGDAARGAAVVERLVEACDVARAAARLPRALRHARDAVSAADRHLGAQSPAALAPFVRLAWLGDSAAERAAAAKRAMEIVAGTARDRVTRLVWLPVLQLLLAQETGNDAMADAARAVLAVSTGAIAAEAESPRPS
ncbi:hypothetical protein M885DRAFT_610980 [Pelagophyceae sp. CCMP2097]|nr:hypothetical protein M885DRAFT_610980 [Pelagophyceae sp. CCMP2097]